jgi:hypothetical protein
MNVDVEEDDIQNTTNINMDEIEDVIDVEEMFKSGKCLFLSSIGE